MEKIDFERKHVLTGYGFDDEGPYLKLDDISGERVRQRFHFRDEVFTLARFKGRRCVGRYSLGTFDEVVCPHSAVLNTRADVCMSCFKAIGFNPAFYNVSKSKLSPQQRAYNDFPHNVYLAHFSAGMIKVGISHAQRTLIRWLDQGVRSAVILKSCEDAYEARGVEKAVQNQFDVSEVVRSKRKRNQLNSVYDINEAERELLQLRWEIYKSMGFPDNNEGVQLIDDYYLGERELEQPLTDITESTPLVVSGRGVGLIGSLLVVEQETWQYVVDVKKFVSHVISLSRELVPNPAESEQMSLL